MDKIVLDFFNDLNDCPALLHEYSDLLSMLKKGKWTKWHRQVEIKNGCSKFVVIFKDLDYVIKVPMNSCCNEGWIPEEEWDEEFEGEKYDHDSSYAQGYWEFENGGCRNDWETYWDYCALEEDYSQSAIDEGLEFVVLPTTYLGEINGYRLYKQAKVDRTWYWNIELDEKSKEKVNKIRTSSDGACALPSSFIAKLIDTFSSDFCKTLFDWIEEYHISDLHCDNIGYRHGHPCIFDFSGYSG